MIDLTSIKARLAAATPGPWEVWEGPEYVGGGADLCIGAGETWLANMEHKRCRTIEQAILANAEHEPVGDCDVCNLGEDDITRGQRGNAEFIAAARADVEALVAEVERLRSRFSMANAKPLKFEPFPGEFEDDGA